MAEIKEVPERGIKSDSARNIIYIVLGAALAIATIVGWLTEAQAETILSSIVSVAGVLGFSLAAANKPKPVVYEQTRPVASERDTTAPKISDVDNLRDD